MAVGYAASIFAEEEAADVAVAVGALIVIVHDNAAAGANMAVGNTAAVLPKAMAAHVAVAIPGFILILAVIIIRSTRVGRQFARCR